MCQRFRQSYCLKLQGRRKLEEVLGKNVDIHNTLCCIKSQMSKTLIISASLISAILFHLFFSLPSDRFEDCVDGIKQ
jgi:hypothetical protein